MSNVPNDYEQQLQGKASKLRALLRPFSASEPEIFRSAPENFRMRAEFRVWHDGDDSYFIMFEPGDRKRFYRVDNFPSGSERINQLMPALRKAIVRNPVLRERLYQVEFLTTSTEDALISLIYHRKLDESWEQTARQLEAELQAAVVGRSRGQKLVISRDWVDESFTVNGAQLNYRQFENGFTQPNAEVNAQMLQRAADIVGETDDDLLELYCGNGNFTCALARRFRRVLATEVAKTSVAAARFNLSRNRITNTALVRLASAEVASALSHEREFRRLREIKIDDYQFSTLFVDPPRAGLDAATLALASRFQRIIYISCNPETLVENIAALSPDYRIDRFALFDQFPFTPHIECGTLLVRDPAAVESQ